MAGSDGTTVNPSGQPDGANAAPAWVAQLPDSLKTEKSFTSFKTIGDFAADYMNKGKEFEALKGQLANSIPKLTENATDEQKTAYYKALGRPDKPEDYKLPNPPKIEGLPPNQSLTDWFKKDAFSRGLTNEQAAGQFDSYNKFMAEVYRQESELQKKETAEAEAKIKAEYGGDEKFKAVKEVVHRAWAKVFPKNEFDAYLKQDRKGPLGNDAQLIKMIFTLLQKTGADTGINPNPAGGPSATTALSYPNSDMGRFAKGG